MFHTCALERVLRALAVVYYPLFFAITALVQGLTAEQGLERAREKFGPLLSRNLLFWVPAQLVQFALVPEEWQVTYVCVMGLMWNVILSSLAGSADGKPSYPPCDVSISGDDDDVVLAAARATRFQGGARGDEPIGEVVPSRLPGAVPEPKGATDAAADAATRRSG
jgi:hypothetical protein